MMTDFALRLDTAAIPYWVERYTLRQSNKEQQKERLIEGEIAQRSRAHQYLTLPDLTEFGKWKSPRSAGLLSRNGSAFVEAVTAIALSTPDAELSIRVLTLLDGVS